jgi:hypothetical protein
MALDVLDMCYTVMRAGLMVAVSPIGLALLWKMCTMKPPMYLCSICNDAYWYPVTALPDVCSGCAVNFAGADPDPAPPPSLTPQQIEALRRWANRPEA